VVIGFGSRSIERSQPAEWVISEEWHLRDVCCNTVSWNCHFLGLDTDDQRFDPEVQCWEGRHWGLADIVERIDTVAVAVVGGMRDCSPVVYAGTAVVVAVGIDWGLEVLDIGVVGSNWPVHWEGLNGIS